jgi:predicted transcriptional regulator of viral defense system
MKYYDKLVDLGCFTRDSLCSLTGNYDTAGSVIKSGLKSGEIQAVKRNLYVAINPADKEPVVSKFRIARAITETAYVSHHAAFEYYGCANQVSYQVEVSSDTRFSSFDFNGNTYAFILSRLSDGVVKRPDGVRVTDMERTVLDGIHDFEKVMGLEELLRCISLVPTLDESKLLKYLAAYGKQAMYQKAGYILRSFQKEFRLSEAFFAECAAKTGKSTRYLTANKAGVFQKEWRLVAPNDLLNLIIKGVDEDADI